MPEKAVGIASLAPGCEEEEMEFPSTLGILIFFPFFSLFISKWL